MTLEAERHFLLLRNNTVCHFCLITLNLLDFGLSRACCVSNTLVPFTNYRLISNVSKAACK
ncbi:TPA: hypothetical protein KOO42_002705 [Clostridioides difficile]|nr:hypothetical protein [Clostridioides difficile]HBG1998999.1 hypothetical protein [Clostridioides difficile]